MSIANGAMLVFLIAGVLLCTRCRSRSADVVPRPGMLYFQAEWCKVCQGMKPIVNELEKKHGKEFDIVWIDIDTSQGKKLAREHAFVGQPTFIMFDSSGEEVRRLMGAQSLQVLEAEIERILGE